jgi:SNF2 family DNA or RNA helicase
MTTTPAPRKSLEPWLFDSVEFYDHQIDGIRTLYPRKSFLLADDMGLGKSLQALTVFCMDVIKGRASTALVVAPVTLKANWADEIEKFTRLNYLVFGQVSDPRRPGRFKTLSKQQRQLQLLDFMGIKGPKVLIVNYEQLASHWQELDNLRFDVGIFDEAHYLKNPKAERTKASMKVRTQRSFMLTGTPMLNQVNELWTLLNRTAPNEFPSYYSFINRYCVFGGYQDKQIIGVKNEGELKERLHGLMLRRVKEDVLKLKKPYIIQRFVELSPAQQELYDEVNEELRLTTVHETDPMDVENALTKFLRLKQICGTTKAFTGKDDSWKLDLVQADTEAILEQGNKIVVFTQFRDVQQSYVDRMVKLGSKKDGSMKWPIYQLHGGVPQEDRVPIVKEWGNVKGPAIIVCMLQVAGIGLNMTAARHQFFIDKLFVPGLNRQAIDRSNRIGQDETQAVQVFEYITKRTVETRVESILKTKVQLNDDIIETGKMGNFKQRLIAALLASETEDLVA